LHCLVLHKDSLKKDSNSCSKGTLLLVVCTRNVALFLIMSASTAKPILFYLGAIIIDNEKVFKHHGLTFLGTAGAGVLSI
jgi:hypothetical protein